MNLTDLQRKLINSARAHPPGDNVPYAFEKRIMACLSGRPALDPWTPWVHGLSRAAALCVLAAVLLGVGSFFLPAASSTSTSENLSQDVETTLLAAVDNTAPAPAADTAPEAQ